MLQCIECYRLVCPGVTPSAPSKNYWPQASRQVGKLPIFFSPPSIPPTESVLHPGFGQKGGGPPIPCQNGRSSTCRGGGAGGVIDSMDEWLDEWINLPSYSGNLICCHGNNFIGRCSNWNFWCYSRILQHASVTKYRNNTEKSKFIARLHSNIAGG